MPIGIASDTSVLMAAEPYGITPRPRSPQGTSARAPTRTVPCSCTQAPAAERPAHPCVHALHRSLRRSVRARRRKGRRSPVDKPAATGAAAAAIGDEAATISLCRPPPLADRAPNPSARPEVALLPPQRPAAAPAAPHVCIYDATRGTATRTARTPTVPQKSFGSVGTGLGRWRAWRGRLIGRPGALAHSVGGRQKSHAGQECLDGSLREYMGQKRSRLGLT